MENQNLSFGELKSREVIQYLNRIVAIKSYRQIPNFCNYYKMYKEAVDNAKGGEVFIEIGSFLGHSACYMGQLIKESKKNITFYCVDPWTAEVFDMEETRFALGFQGSYANEIRKAICELSLQGYVKMLQMTSEEASKHFLKHSIKFDFVFLDGLHDYESVKADISYWFPLLKIGGVIGGDDYYWRCNPEEPFFVRQAILDTIGENHSADSDTTHPDSNGWAFWSHKKEKELDFKLIKPSLKFK